MQPFSAPLRDHPQAKQLLENQAAIRQMLANPETQKNSSGPCKRKTLGS